MFHPRVFAPIAVAISLLVVPAARAAGGGPGIAPIGDQDIPSGKTLIVPIPATDGTDPNAPARSYTVTVGPATTSGTVPATAAGIHAIIRTGDPHLILGVTYAMSTSSSTTAIVSGTMDYQLLREFTPVTTQIIGGLAQGGYYSPQSTGSSPYVVFGRVAPSTGIIQLGTPSGDGRGGIGFTFANELSSALIFSGTAGQMAMANSGATAPESNGTQFFITLDQSRGFDFGYTLFGQLIRGFDTLSGIANTPLSPTNMFSVDQGAEDEPVTPVNITSVALTTNNTDAVLILSATGVCDAPITVVATSGTLSTTGTFEAHAIADNTDDPPILAPVPDIVAPNGNVKVALQGTDLQLDYLQYGYIRVAPVEDASVTSGSSPLVTIPLISNTDNEDFAALDHWNATPGGFTYREFHVAAGDKPIRGTLSPIPAGTMGTDKISAPFTAAVFTSGNLKETGTDFTATVSWGDGSPLVSGSSIAIVKDSTARTVNRYKVEVLATGTTGNPYAHEYTSPGEYPVKVNISDPGGARLALTGTANVGPSTIALAPEDFYNTGGAVKNQALGTFTDNADSVGPAGYTTTVNWGDGIVSSGSLKELTPSSYRVYGTHTYTYPAAYTVSTSVLRTGTTNSASGFATAHVAGVTAPQVLPPFPQAHLAQVWATVQSDSNSVITTGNDAGGNPYSILVQGTNSELYGTTRNGGVNGDGTIFKITTGGAINTLYSFTSGSDGGHPSAGVITGTDGSLYGTTSEGGSFGYGTVYQLTASGSLNVLHAFDGSDGGVPLAAPVSGTDGFLYGTTASGSNGVDGTVYMVNTKGSFTTLHSFLNDSGGGAPTGPLLLATSGSFYGTTSTSTSGTGPGTIFAISSSGAFATINTLTSSNTNAVLGSTPFGGLVTGTDGNFYGTTAFGGANNLGTIYRVTASGSLTTIYSFSGGDDGSNPVSGLISGTDGLLYGTTPLGGANQVGALFSVSISGSLDALYSFTRNGGGRDPQQPPTLASDGKFYGTTELGGDNGYGAVYQFNASSLSYNPIYSFTSGETFQIAVQGAVDILNSGNRTSSAATFSVYYYDPVQQQDYILSVNGQTVLPVNGGAPLAPGQYSLLSFSVVGSISDTRPLLPVGYDPTGDSVVGQVNYTDPVGSFDGSQTIVTAPGSL